MGFRLRALGDMACHVLDPVFSGLKLKYPVNVEACASPVNRETFPLASIIRFEFPAREGMPPVKLSWYDGGLKPPRPKELENPEMRIGQAQSGAIFIGEKGILRTGEYGDNPRLFPLELNQQYRNANASDTNTVSGSGNVFAAANGSGRAGGRRGRGGFGGGGMGAMRGGGPSHEGNWIEACKAGVPANAVSNFDYSGPFTETVVMGCLALRFLDQKLLWDGENMKFTNNQNATDYVTPKYREGWSMEM